MVEELRSDVKRRFNIAIPNGRLYRAKAYALETLKGSVTGHYAKLRSCISELMKVDREGRFELLVGDGTIFKGLYIDFSALKKGFVEGCRPIIGLDGCFLKTHLGGQLLCAIGKNGINQMYPIAWAVVEVENEMVQVTNSYRINKSVTYTDGSGYIYLHYSVIEFVVGFDKCCVRSSYKEEWDASMDKLKAENMMAYENFIERDPSRFCKAFISTACVSDMVDNNVSETFNGYILNARGKHIIDMLEEIRSDLRERQFKKLKHVESVSDVLTPAARKKVEKLKSLARFCTAHPGLGGKFEVENKDDRFIVSLPERTCSCRVWELTGIPCIHAISAVHFMKKDPANYVHKYLTTETYLKAYSYPLEPINGERQWPKAVGYPVQPPEVKVMPGRPKKNRRRDKDEKDPKNPSRLTRVGTVMTCQNYFQAVHNSRECKNETVEKEKPEKRKPGRPRKHPRPEDCVNSSGASKSKKKSKSKTLAMERGQASKGVGHFVGEETGNSYICSGSIVHQVPRGEKLSSQVPTQQSQTKN
ncbi:uncharacterized protein LOC131009751 [Salvia miltiorrhiza]|uniref:uncharacterized protein LOC131009751 n=1 Tax=Salvia miltiorrhiza TaxID=226208 RepID=UPI0025AB8F87|nr:uncharacterized protein LOC131009751 [Salvia miltiorrhiza]